MSKRLSFSASFAAAFTLGIVALNATAQAEPTQAIPQAAYTYKQLARQQAEAVWGLNAPTATLAAQVHQESGFNCNAKSWVGALGCAQFMPATAADMAKRYPAELGPANPHNPRWAFRAQARYMLALYDGRGAHGAANSCERMAFAAAAYNGGEGWVLRDRALSDRMGNKPGVFFGAAQVANAGRRADFKRENAEYPQRILYQIEPRYIKAGFGKGSCT